MTEPTYTSEQLETALKVAKDWYVGIYPAYDKETKRLAELLANRIATALTKQREELLAPGPCGKHLAIFWIEGAHTPHEGDLEHICAPDCESDYCTICIEEQHIRDEAYGEALRAAATTICQFCTEGIPFDDAGHVGDRHCYAKTIRALTPTAIREAQERHDAEIRLDEAKLNPMTGASRIAALERAATKSQAEGKKT